METKHFTLEKVGLYTTYGDPFLTGRKFHQKKKEEGSIATLYVGELFCATTVFDRGPVYLGRRANEINCSQKPSAFTQSPKPGAFFFAPFCCLIFHPANDGSP